MAPRQREGVHVGLFGLETLMACPDGEDYLSVAYDDVGSGRGPARNRDLEFHQDKGRGSQKVNKVS